MSIELDRTDRTDERHPTSPQEYDDPPPALPPADKGAGAWLFLLGSFLIEAVIWGELLILSRSSIFFFFSSKDVLY